ncbi:hypothetical protein BV898_14254 [Hypsibius exemplaris]|uniref:Uncharacterized protein n=1 Tax=Hypsibius exemplaris TaxID=2072580 RepID=A0A1W0W8G4_HYPEX|nr:hypothetical protein BV898_14254 [Hypsibius exemplaris]
MNPIWYHYQLLLLALLLASLTRTNAENTRINANCISDGFIVECTGAWPTEELQFPANNNTVKVIFRDVVFRSDDLRPLSHVNIKCLEFHNAIAFDASGKEVSLPLQAITIRLDRRKIETLYIEQALIVDWDAELLQDFSRLSILTVGGSRITSVMSNALMATPSLTQFYFEENKLTQFIPWIMFYPAKTALQVIKISNNPDLKQIIPAEMPAGELFAPFLTKLAFVIVSGNPFLTTINETILAIIGRESMTSTIAISIEFVDNGNQCGGCGQSPLIGWVRNTLWPFIWTDANNERNLTVNCQSKCSEKSGESGTLISGNATYWLAYETSACDATIQTPCPDALVSDQCVVYCIVTDFPYVPFANSIFLYRGKPTGVVVVDGHDNRFVKGSPNQSYSGAWSGKNRLTCQSR